MSLNLLPNEAKFQAQRIQFRKKSDLVSKIILTIWLLAIIVVIAWWLLVKMVVNKSETKKDQAMRQFMGLADNVVINQNLRYKAKLVGQILNNRFEYAKTFRSILALFPVGVTVNKYELKTGKVFTIQGEIGNSLTMDAIEAMVKSVNNQENPEFEKAKLTSMKLDDNNWSFSMEISIK